MISKTVFDPVIFRRYVRKVIEIIPGVCLNYMVVQNQGGYSEK